MMFTIFAADASTYEMILMLSVMIVIGLFAGRFFERRRVPNLVAYVLIGIALGAFLILVNYRDIIDAVGIVINIGIGFISFSIGLELNYKHIKSRAKEVVIVTFFQAIFAFLLTFIALYVFLLPFHIALILGALAIATEPGPILMITKRMRAQGPLTDTLVPLHGVEDAITIMLFGITLAYATSVEEGTPFGVIEMLSGPVLEIIFSIVIAMAIGYILVRIIRYLKYEDTEKDVVILISAVVAILVSVAIANTGLELFHHHIHLSPILLPMSVGITFANMSTDLAKHETERIMDLFSAPILIVFFTILGAELVLLLVGELETLNIVLILLVSLTYVVMRLIGKLSGSYVGSRLAKSTQNIQRYLGFCLLPQAQAAIGLAFYARSSLSDTPYGTMILIVIVISTVVNGVIGPLGVRHALIQCNEADGQFCVIGPASHHHSHHSHEVKH